MHRKIYYNYLVVVVLIKLDATSLDEVVAANRVDPQYQQSLVGLLAFSNDELEPVAVHVARYDD